MSAFLAKVQEWLKAMLSNSDDVSAMRIMSFISLFAGIGIAFDGLHSNKDIVNLTALVSMFVGSAFGGKVLQKALEVKQNLGSKD